MRKTIAALVLLAACISNAHAANIAKDGRAAVSRSLKDPESARFRDTFVNGVSFCGYVNAKNSYGGYVGFRRFAVIGPSVSIEASDGGDSTFEVVWREACWLRERLRAYHKEQQELSGAADRDIERQRAEIRVMMEEKNRAIEAENAADK